MHSEKYEKFEQKTDDWLSATDLLKFGHLVGDVAKIRSALYRYQKDMPEYIKMKSRKTRTTICLFKDKSIIEQFCKLAGFSTPEDEYTSEWLNATELENTHICANADVIKKNLYKFQSDMPKYIQVKVKRINSQDCRNLCLFGNPLVIRSFCIMAKLQQPTDPKPQENEWLSLGELCRKINCTPAELLKVVQSFQSDMPKDINPQIIFGIRNDPNVIAALRNKIDLMSAPSAIPTVFVPVVATPAPVINEKSFNSKDWISVSGLMRKKIVHGATQKISDALKEYENTNPDDVLKKTFRGGVILCLRNEPSVIKRFNEMLDSKKPAKPQTPKFIKDDWLSILLLFKQKIASGSYKKVENALKQWHTTNPDDVLEKPRGNGFSYHLRNDADVIKRFSDTFNKKEWISCTGLVKQKLIRGTTQKITDALKEYQRLNPADVQEITVKGNTGLHLRNTQDAIKRFKESLEPRKAETVGGVSEQWLSASDLEYRYIDAGFTSISEKLYVLQSSMPDLIQHKNTPRGDRLCLKRVAIQAFCEKAGFAMITLKTSNWLSAADLIKQNYVSGAPKTIRNALLLNKSYKPDYVQTKRTSTGTLSLCLLDDPDAITWLRKKLLVPPTLFPDEAPKWILVDDLSEKYIMAPRDKIRTKLEEFSDVLRNDIWFAKRRGHRVVYLHRDAIEKFAQIAGFKTATEIATTMAKVSAMVDFSRDRSKQKS